jgi:hypothetical protein
MDNKILSLEEYINKKKFGDAESRKHLLELIKDAFGSINIGIQILTTSFGISEKDISNSDCMKAVDKQIDISNHMLAAIDELDKVFSILEELIEEKRKAEEMKR